MLNHINMSDLPLMKKIGVGLAGALMLATGANQLQRAVEEQKRQGARGDQAAQALNASLFIASAQALHALTAPPKKRVKPDFSALSVDDRAAAESSYAEVEHQEALAEHVRTGANFMSITAALIPDSNGTMKRATDTVNSMHSFLRNASGMKERKAAAISTCETCKELKEVQENGNCNDCNSRAAGIPAEVEAKCPECGERKHLQSNGKCNACNELAAHAAEVYQEAQDRMDAKQRAEARDEKVAEPTTIPAVHHPILGRVDDVGAARLGDAVRVAAAEPVVLGPFNPEAERFLPAPAGDRPRFHWHGPSSFSYNVQQIGHEMYTILCNGSIHRWTGEENGVPVCQLCRVPQCSGRISTTRQIFNRRITYFLLKIYDRRAGGSTAAFAAIVAESRARWSRPDIRLTAARIAQFLYRNRPSRGGVALAAVTVAGAAAAAFGAYKLRQSNGLEEARANFMRVTRSGAHRAGLHAKTPHPECELCQKRTITPDGESRGQDPKVQTTTSIGPGAPPPWLQSLPPTKMGGESDRSGENKDQKADQVGGAKGAEAFGISPITAATLALGAVGTAVHAADVVGSSRLEESVRQLAEEMKSLKSTLQKVTVERDAAVENVITLQRIANTEKRVCKYGTKCSNSSKKHAELFVHVDPEAEATRWAEMPTRGKNKGGRGTQKRAAKASTSHAKKGKFINGVWYDEDPAEAGQRVWLSAGEVFEEVRYGSDRMKEILANHGQQGAQYVVPEAFHDYDGESGFTMTFKTRGGLKTFSTGSEDGRRAAMAYMLRSGMDTKKITCRDASGHIHRPATLSFRSGAAGPSVRVQYDEKGDYLGRTSGFARDRDIEEMMAPVRGQRWDEIEDDPDAESKRDHNIPPPRSESDPPKQKCVKCDKPSLPGMLRCDRHRIDGTTDIREPGRKTEAREVLKDGPGFDGKGNWCFICRACRKPATWMRVSVERARQRYGDDWIAPSTCYQCHQARIRFEQGVKLTDTPPEYQIQRRDVKPRDMSTEHKDPIQPKEETVSAESAIQTGKPADIAAAMATLPFGARKAKTTPQMTSISQADLKAVGEALKKAESIQAANPITYVDIATKTARVLAKFFREKLGKATPEVSSGFATEHWFICTQHGTKYSEERIEAHYGHNYGMKHMAYDPNANTAHHGTPIPGTDLMIFPRPQGMKWFNLAKPVQGQPVFVYPCHRAERGHGFGHVLALGVDTEYKDGQGHIWSAPALAAANYESEGGCSGMPVTNAKGDAVGVHVTSDGTPGSPAYFIPFTDELIEILKKPPKPLNSIAGSSTTQVQSKRV